MANPFYTFVARLIGGTRAKANDINAQLDLVTTGFDGVSSAKANLASPAFTGTPTAPTAAADTNTTQLATTAFVVAQAAGANPLVDGSVAVGTSLRYARADHVHPTDTSRAPLASPTFTGTPAAPTAAVDTNTTQLASTAFVLAQAAAANPLVDGSVAVGTSTRYARADHVHPTDTSRAPLASPNFSGTPQIGGVNIATVNSTVANATNATNAGTASVASSVAWTNVSGRPTAVSAFTNDSGYYNAGTSPSFTNVTASQYAISSSRDLKQNIAPYSHGALERVLHWNIVEYEYIATPDRREIGLIAEDSDERVSDGAAISSNAALFELAAAVQELATRVKALESR